MILDSFTLNPGDLSWSSLAKLGELETHDWTPPELVHDRAAGAPIVLTNKTVLSGDTLRSLPDLRYIGVLATGYNVVDLATAVERQIPVSNVPGYGTPSVEPRRVLHALLLELADESDGPPCGGGGRRGAVDEESRTSAFGMARWSN